MKILLLILFFIFSSACTQIIVNTKALINQEPKLIASVTNGQKLMIGDLNSTDRNILYIANLKGTPQQMGEAFGQLFKQELKDMFELFYDYYLTMLLSKIQSKIPKFLDSTLTSGSKISLHKILDLNVMITKKYTSKRIYEQIRGIGKGSKLPAKQVARLNIFPQLIKAACTVAGVWGPASQNNKTIHLRGLDWDSNNPINKYPLVTIYHPSNKSWHTHANFAWIGFVGSLTGMSDKLTIGQKVWLPPKGTVKMTRYGNPWTYLFRDIMYDAHNLQQAIKILSTTHRTCAIHIGIGSIQDHSFRMFEYSWQILNNYDDQNYTHYGKNHPKRAGLAYFDKHVQPSGDSQVGDVLNSDLYGHWTAEKLWRTLGFTHKTGDTQLAVFDLEQKSAYIAYSKFNSTEKAYTRSPIYLNMSQLFADF